MFLENYFLVLPDGRTVIGADASDRTKLIMEDITQGNRTEIATHGGIILTLLFDPRTETLLVGDQSRHVKQYKRENKSFTLVKDYGDVGVDWIWSSAKVGEFAIFGGDNHSLIAIDIKNQTLLKGSLKTAYKSVYSLQVCFTNNHKLLLAVSGSDPNFSPDKSDLFDVTCLSVDDPNLREVFPFKDLSQANKTILNLQMTIQAQQETINKLTRKCEKYQTNLEEIQFKNKDVLDQNKNTLTKSYNHLKTQSEIKNKEFTKKINLLNQHKSKRTTIGTKKSLIGTGLFDETDPLVIIRDLREDLDQEKDKNRQLENSIFNAIALRRQVEEDARVINQQLKAARNRNREFHEVLSQK